MYSSSDFSMFIHRFLNSHADGVGVRYQPHGTCFIQLSIASQSTRL